jgi:hypothetical protein
MLVLVEPDWVRLPGMVGGLMSGQRAVAATTRTIAELFPESSKLATPAV